MTRRIKRLLVCMAAGLLYYSGLLSVRLSFRRRVLGKREACVIGLHRVLPDNQWKPTDPLGGIAMRDSTFVELLKFLKRNFLVSSLDSFLASMWDTGASPKPLCLITFDDGWQDNYTTALPRLSELQIPAVVFVVTGLLDHRRTFWVERLSYGWQKPELREQIRSGLAPVTNARFASGSFEDLVEHLKHMPATRREALLATGVPWLATDSGCNAGAMLNWDEVARLEEQGVEIESHTVNHPLLAYEDTETVKEELVGAKAALESRLKKRVRAFAYPNGCWDRRVRDLVQGAGYDCAFTTASGWFFQGEDPFAIRRIMLHEESLMGLDGRFSPAVLALRLTGWA